MIAIEPQPSISRSDVTTVGASWDDFRERASALATEVVFTSRAGLLSSLEHAVSSYSDGGVGVTEELALLIPETESLRRAGQDWPSVAIGFGHLGVASTGSVLAGPATRSDRLLTLLALKHVIVLPGDRIVPSLPDGAAFVRGLTAAGRRYLTFVSGPSRTSDIERVVTIGVHGPKEVAVVVVEDWETDSA